jgi:hypothetical protein
VSMTKTLEMLSSDIQGTLTVLEKLKDSNNWHLSLRERTALPKGSFKPSPQSQLTFFLTSWLADPKIHMEIWGIQNSKHKLEKEK